MQMQIYLRFLKHTKLILIKVNAYFGPPYLMECGNR